MPKTKKSSVAFKPEVPVKPRRVKQSNYKSFRRHKRIKPSTPKLSSVYRLSRQTGKLLKQNWKLFLTITIIYGVLTVILVRGFSGSLDLSSLKSTLKSGFSGSTSSLFTGVTVFGYLLGSSGTSTDPGAGVYQTILIIVVSLASIWALREVLAGHKIKARDSFYKGMYPLIPFIIILLVIGIELLPLLAGNWLYSTVVANNIAGSGLEKFLWAVFALLLAVLSLYMICSSIFALYIVTLPNMTPLKALRSARQLVRFRRWTVLRKLLFLPIVLLIIAAIIMVPLIIFVTPAAEWVFFLLSMFTLVVANTYIYTLYRELL